MPHFSIITVVYNAENLIDATIKSILSQSFKDFEYIIIDGKSNDGTVKVINQYVDQIKTFISEPDTGVYDGMNKGLVAATGSYVLFINAGDELVHASVLQNIFDKSNNADIIYGETNIIDKSRKIIGTRTQLTSRKLPDRLIKKDFLQGQVVSHQSFIAKRTLTRHYNLQYKCSADIDWMLHIITQSKNTVNIGEPISNYLQGGISDTHLYRCWKERFLIFLNYFSMSAVLIAHLKFAIRFIYFGKYKQSH